VFPNFAKTLSDDLVRRVELESTLVGVDRVRHLIVASFVECSEVEPDFRKVWVNSNRSRVGVEGIVELVDVVVEDSDRTPERRVLSVSINSLLISFVSFTEIVCRHVRSTEQVPREWIVRVYEEFESCQ